MMPDHADGVRATPEQQPGTGQGRRALTVGAAVAIALALVLGVLGLLPAMEEDAASGVPGRRMRGGAG